MNSTWKKILPQNGGQTSAPFEEMIMLWKVNVVPVVSGTNSNEFHEHWQPEQLFYQVLWDHDHKFLYHALLR
jgi:hypothetical protein